MAPLDAVARSGCRTDTPRVPLEQSVFHTGNSDSGQTGAPANSLGSLPRPGLLPSHTERADLQERLTRVTVYTGTLNRLLPTGGRGAPPGAAVLWPQPSRCSSAVSHGPATSRPGALLSRRVSRLHGDAPQSPGSVRLLWGGPAHGWAGPPLIAQASYVLEAQIGCGLSTVSGGLRARGPGGSFPVGSAGLGEDALSGAGPRSDQGLPVAPPKSGSSSSSSVPL